MKDVYEILVLCLHESPKSLTYFDDFHLKITIRLNFKSVNLHEINVLEVIVNPYIKSHYICSQMKIDLDEILVLDEN